MNEEIINLTAKTLHIHKDQVKAVLNLLSEGATVPFIARYRKEVTGALNEDQIRAIAKEYDYALKLKERKEDVIRLIEEKGMMNDELKKAILEASKLTEVEDYYRPYKKKKKTRATIAIAKGLEPLAVNIQRTLSTRRAYLQRSLKRMRLMKRVSMPCIMTIANASRIYENIVFSQSIVGKRKRS